MKREIVMPVDGVELPGTLAVPDDARGIVVFAHGTGSSRLSPRNAEVARRLRASGRFGTLLFDLLTEAEDVAYGNRFDIDLLTERLLAASRWTMNQREATGLPLGFFGASTGAAAAVRAAAVLPEDVRTVVSRGGRPDLAGDALRQVHVPTLLIVGGADPTVLELNREAYALLGTQDKRLDIIPEATHLFEEPGALDQVAELTRTWFERWLGAE
jgi:dienelactone hydrolase